MGGGIYLIKGEGELVRMDQEDYDSEPVLQKLLAKYPDLLAGDQIDDAEPRRWVLITREARIPGEESGAGRLALDHLFLDQDGIPTLVEVKRSSDTRVRREVVGQMLDYAANAVAYFPVEEMRAAFEQRCEKDGDEAEEALARALGEEIEYQEFWQQVKTNLTARRIRLLFVADRIPAELRRVVEFLNETMDPVEVLALEVPQYVGQEHKALVPRIIGRTARAVQAKGVPPPRTDRETFLATWEAPQREKYERLLKFAAERGLTIFWGRKGFSLKVPVEGVAVSILEGYPPDVAPGYLVPFGGLRRRVRGGEELGEWYRAELSSARSAPRARGCAAPSSGWTRRRRSGCAPSLGSSWPGCRSRVSPRQGAISPRGNPAQVAQVGVGLGDGDAAARGDRALADLARGE